MGRSHRTHRGSFEICQNVNRSRKTYNSSVVVPKSKISVSRAVQWHLRIYNEQLFFDLLL